jgi:hypothetical protein
VRALTLSAALAAGGALVARTAALVAALAVASIVLAFVVLGATYARASKGQRVGDHLPAVGRGAVVFVSAVAALIAIGGVMG